MSTVTFEGVTKKYGEVLAVDNLSLEIVDGEFMVLVGPDRKSTRLNSSHMSESRMPSSA